MGMHDNITVDIDFKLPLPTDLQGIEENDILLCDKQTTSFDNTLEIFLLRADGVMYHIRSDSNFERQWVPYTKYEAVEFSCFIKGKDKDAYILWSYNMVTKECKLQIYRVTDKEDNVHARALKKAKLLNKWYMRPYLWYKSAVRSVFRIWYANSHKIPKAWIVEAWLTPL